MMHNRSSYFLRLIKFTCVVGIAGFLAAQQIQAQVGSGIQLGISITPPLSEIALQPGKTVIQAFNIQNTSGADLEITPNIVEMTADENTGDPVVEIDGPAFPYANLQNLDKELGKPFVLKAGTKDQLVVRIAIPKDHGEKDYYQTLLLKTQSVQQNTIPTTQSMAYVGVHMLIRVSAENQEQPTLEIYTFKVPTILDIFSPLQFSIKVQNPGKTYQKSFGQVSISSLFKKDAATMQILPQNVLSQARRELFASKPDPENQRNLLATPFVYDPAIFFGPHTIQLQLQDQDGKTYVVYSKKVWGVPLSPMIVVLFLLIIKQVLKKTSKKHTISVDKQIKK